MFDHPLAAVGHTVYTLLVIQAFRPDRLTSAAQMFVNSVMGSSFMHDAETELDLGNIVENEVWYILSIEFCVNDTR